jgi:hypothetical protein
MDLMLVLLLVVGVIHIVFSRLKRRSEQHRSGWKAHLDDTPPRQARARKKVG